MPDTGRPLPIPCPKCQHESCVLVVKSLTVMTCQCDKCHHTWAIALETLPADIQQKVRLAVRDL